MPAFKRGFFFDVFYKRLLRVFRGSVTLHPIRASVTLDPFRE